MSAPRPIIAEVLRERLVSDARSQRSYTPEVFQRVATAAEVVLDFGVSLAGVYLAYFAYFALNVGKHVQYPLQEVSVVGIVVGLLITLLLERDGAYEGGVSLLRIRETERAIRIPTQALLLLLPITFLFGRTFSRGSLVIALFIVPTLLVLEKSLFFSVIRILHAKGFGTRRVIIYGAGYTGKRVLSALLHSPKLGLNPVTILDDDPALEGNHVYEMGYQRRRSIEVQNGPVTPAFLTDSGCDLMVVAIPSLNREKFSELVQVAEKAKVQVAFLPGQAVNEHHWMESFDIDGLLLTFVRKPVTSWRYIITKRVVDLVGSLIILLLSSPALLVISLLVWLDSPGLVLFRQKRVGKDGRLFDMYKFRSMRIDAPKYGVSPTESLDPRITRVGRFLRRTSLDEIPQLFNVLKGDMSLVGPRPEMPFIVDGYDLRQRQRLQVIPGITGLWQLSADRAFHIHENIQYDLYYIRNRGFFLDVAILVHTAFFAMRGV